MKKSKVTVGIAMLITVGVPLIGYLSFGIIPAILFFIGYLGGFVLWILNPQATSFEPVRKLYWITFALFILHRVEEKVSGFFDVLAEMTGVSKPEIISVPIILLLIISVGAWLFGPALMKRKFPVGGFLVWSFFASMGITELAHFVLPFFWDKPYGYFPGMLSVIVLAPVAWYAMYRLVKGSNQEGELKCKSI